MTTPASCERKALLESMDNHPEFPKAISEYFGQQVSDFTSSTTLVTAANPQTSRSNDP